MLIMISFFHFFVKLTGWFPWVLLTRPVIRFQDRAVQGRRIKGKAIVVANHVTVMDVAALMFLFPFRVIRCVVAEIMFQKNFFMTFFLKALGAFKVERQAYDFSFLGKCKKVLDKGGVVEIFPEARIPEPWEEKPLPFKPSAVYLALESGAPIIPVYTDGRYFEKGRYHVVVGTPIDVRALYDEALDEKENISNITTYLRGKIIELGKQIEEEKEN